MTAHSLRDPNGPPSSQREATGSKLGLARERFLSMVVEHALLVGRRTPKDFLRHFPPREIMQALRDQPRLRAKILVATTGIDERIAVKKTPASAGDDLEIALAEGVTGEGDVVSLFDPDDRVSFLENAALWAFVTEGEFWRASAEGTPQTVAREHLAFILARARAERLVTDREIIDAIGLPMLIDCLPKEDLGRVIERALEEGRAGRVFKDERMFDVVTPALLVEHVALSHLWERVIAPKLSFKRLGATSLPPPRASGLPPSPLAASVPKPLTAIAVVPVAPPSSEPSTPLASVIPSPDLRSQRDLDLDLDVDEPQEIVVGD